MRLFEPENRPRLQWSRHHTETLISHVPSISRYISPGPDQTCTPTRTRDGKEKMVEVKFITEQCPSRYSRHWHWQVAASICASVNKCEQLLYQKYLPVAPLRLKDRDLLHWHTPVGPGRTARWSLGAWIHNRHQSRRLHGCYGADSGTVIRKRRHLQVRDSPM